MQTHQRLIKALLPHVYAEGQTAMAMAQDAVLDLAASVPAETALALLREGAPGRAPDVQVALRFMAAEMLEAMLEDGRASGIVPALDALLDEVALVPMARLALRGWSGATPPRLAALERAETLAEEEQQAVCAALTLLVEAGGHQDVLARFLGSEDPQVFLEAARGFDAGLPRDVVLAHLAAEDAEEVLPLLPAVDPSLDAEQLAEVMEAIPRDHPTEPGLADWLVAQTGAQDEDWWAALLEAPVQPGLAAEVVARAAPESVLLAPFPPPGEWEEAARAGSRFTALARRGHPVERLVALLGEADKEAIPFFEVAGPVLAASRPPVAPLLAIAEAGLHYKRWAAIVALGGVLDEVPAKHWQAWLGSPSVHDRLAAARACGLAPTLPEPVVAALVTLMEQPSDHPDGDEPRLEALRALRRRGVPVEEPPELVAQLSELEALRPGVDDALLEQALASEDTELEAAAAALLAQRADAHASAMLVEALEDCVNQEALLVALEACGEHAPAEAFEALLDSDWSEVRRAAAGGLRRTHPGRFAERAAQALETLQRGAS